LTYYAFLFPKKQECFANAEKDMCEGTRQKRDELLHQPNII